MVSGIVKRYMELNILKMFLSVFMVFFVVVSFVFVKKKVKVFIGFVLIVVVVFDLVLMLDNLWYILLLIGGIVVI